MQMRRLLLRKIVPLSGVGRIYASRKLHTPSLESMKHKVEELLPIRHTVSPSLTVRMEPLQESQIPGVTEWIQKLAENGDGLSVDEFSRSPNVLENLASSPAITVFEENSDKLVGFIVVRSSPLCRSTNPIHHAGYIMLDPGSGRKRGLAQALFGHIEFFGKTLGYSGLLGRTSVISPGVYSLRMHGTKILGVLPNSVNLGAMGWIDDVILHHSYQEIQRQVGTPPRVPPLQSDPPLGSPHQSCSVLSPNEPLPDLPVPCMGRTSHLRVSHPTDHDLHALQAMIRQAAQEGEGFALDEFTESGAFNARMLWDRNTAVMKQPEGTLVAGVVFGATTLARSPNSGQVGGYVVVGKDFRGRGVGRAVLKYCIEQAERRGYKAVLSDVFTTSDVGLHLVLRAGFQVMGTLPHCGYLKDTGYTDSLVVYRACEKATPSAKL